MSGVLLTGVDADATLSALRPARAEGVARAGVATGSLVWEAVAGDVAAARGLATMSKASGASSAARRLGGGGNGMVRSSRAEEGTVKKQKAARRPGRLLLRGQAVR